MPLPAVLHQDGNDFCVAVVHLEKKISRQPTTVISCLLLKTLGSTETAHLPESSHDLLVIQRCVAFCQAWVMARNKRVLNIFLCFTCPQFRDERVDRHHIAHLVQCTCEPIK